jgi:hypothetical protein
MTSQYLKRFPSEEKSGILYGTVPMLTSFQHILEAVTMGSYELQDAETSNSLNKKKNKNHWDLGRFHVSFATFFLYVINLCLGLYRIAIGCSQSP